MKRTEREVNLSVVERLQPLVDAADLVVVFNFDGVSAPEFDLLRLQLQEVGGHVRVVRNATGRWLFRSRPPEAWFKGPCALLLARRPRQVLLSRVYRVLEQGSLIASIPSRSRSLPSSLRIRGIWYRGHLASARELAGGKERDPDGTTLPAHVVAQYGPLFDEPAPAVSRRLDIARFQGIREGLRPRLEPDPTDLLPPQLRGLGDNPILVMAVLRRNLELSLQEIRRLTRNLPFDLPRGEHLLLGELEEVGAEVWTPGPRAPEGYSEAVVEADALLSSTPHLHVRPGYRLGGSVYRSGDNGHGSIFGLASPRGGPLPLVESIVGDGSVEACVEASIFLRECTQYGAMWHGVSWWAHEYVDAPDDRDWQWQTLQLGDRTLRLDARADLAPRVIRHETATTVSFYTMTDYVSSRIVLHLDHYPDNRVEDADVRSLVVARTEGGYVH